MARLELSTAVFVDRNLFVHENFLFFLISVSFSSNLKLLIDAFLFIFDDDRDGISRIGSDEVKIDDSIELLTSVISILARFDVNASVFDKESLVELGLFFLSSFVCLSLECTMVLSSILEYSALECPGSIESLKC